MEIDEGGIFSSVIVGGVVAVGVEAELKGSARATAPAAGVVAVVAAPAFGSCLDVAKDVLTMHGEQGKGFNLLVILFFFFHESLFLVVKESSTSSGVR